MNFDILTIFPDFFDGPLRNGVVSRGISSGVLNVHIHNLRDWTHDRHKSVDDRPFGGAEGMLLKPEPIFGAVESIWPSRPDHSKIILLSAQGRKFDQRLAREFSEESSLLLICGRYEGVDERVAEHLADEEISIGNYVLSGGELPALVMIDAIARLLPGVVGNCDSTTYESFETTGHSEGLLDCPQYTRPADFRGWKVPEVLLSGHHEQIRQWRKSAAREKTVRLRPDLFR